MASLTNKRIFLTALKEIWDEPDPGWSGDAFEEWKKQKNLCKEVCCQPPTKSIKPIRGK